MAIVRMEDMEGEATVVVFPKTYKECESCLYGETDPETGAVPVFDVIDAVAKASMVRLG